MKHFQQSDYVWLSGLILGAAAILYLATLDNGLRPEELAGGDLITHQYAQVEARPSNAPGYPLYTMGGWLWFRLGRLLLGHVLNPIQILSLYSTLWALAALLVLFLILRQITLSPSPLPPLLTLFYATTFFFWYYSVTTEQYTSAVFQTLLLIWLAFRWDDTPRDATLLWLAFVSGTLLANMVTTLFILPPLLWFVLFKPATDRTRPILFSLLQRPRLVWQTLALALLPLLSYAYIYIRGAQHPEWRGTGDWPTTWAWFVQFLTIQQGRDELAPGLTGQNFFTTEFPALMWQELTWPVFVGGLLGLACLGKRRAVFLYSTLLLYLIFSWSYRFGNWFQVIIPAYPILIIGFAAGLNRLMAWSDEWSMPGRRWSPASRVVVILFLAGLLAYRFTTNLPQANQRNLAADTGLEPGWAILADRPQAPARIATDFAELVALQYLRSMWQIAPGIQPVAPDQLLPASDSNDEDPHLYASRRALAAAPELINADTHPQATGVQLIALQTAPQTVLPPAPVVPLNLDFGGKLELLGWEPVEIPDVRQDPDAAIPWQIALYWRAAGPLSEDFTVSVRPLVGGRPVERAGTPVIQDHRPVWGLYPTHRWQPGEVVRDVYALDLPPGLAPDAVQIVVYKTSASGFENLADHTVALATIK